MTDDDQRVITTDEQSQACAHQVVMGPSAPADVLVNTHDTPCLPDKIWDLQLWAGQGGHEEGVPQIVLLNSHCIQLGYREAISGSAAGPAVSAAIFVGGKQERHSTNFGEPSSSLGSPR